MLCLSLVMFLAQDPVADSGLGDFSIEVFQESQAWGMGGPGAATGADASAGLSDSSVATSDGRMVFRTEEGGTRLRALDPWNDRAGDAVDLGMTLGKGLVLHGDVDAAFCVEGEGRLALFNTASHRESGSLDGVGQAPQWIQQSWDGRFVFVGGVEAKLWVLDGPGRVALGSLDLPARPTAGSMLGEGLGLWLEGGQQALVRWPLAAHPSSQRERRGETEVFVMGMTHSKHRTSERWGLAQVEETIRRLKPDVIVTEIPPDRWEAALAGWRQDGEVSEPRVLRFPEYTDVLFRLMDEMGFAVEPAAAWTTEMNELRKRRIEEFETAPRHAERHAAMQAAEAELEAWQAREPLDEDDPWVIHSEAYDLRTEAVLQPYDLFLNDWIGPGGWTHINLGHARLVRAAADRHLGKRVLVTFGAGHKYWLKRHLAAAGFTLGDLRPYLPGAPMQDSQARIEIEVQELHQFFEDWFLGRLPDSDEAYGRFAGAMGEGFQIISPTGKISPRAGLLDGLRAAHGSRLGSSLPYAIRVRNVAARELGNGLWLATYEEWQDADGLTMGRTSSALLREDAAAPGGWSWLHVHETWLE